MKEEQNKQEVSDEPIVLNVAEILENADQDTQKLILALIKRVRRAESERVQAKKSELQTILDKMDSDLALGLAHAEIDSLSANMGVTLNKLETSYDKLRTTKILELDARLKQNMSEAVEKSLWSAISNVIDRVEGMGTPEKDVLKEEIWNDLDRASQKIVDAILLTKGLEIPERKEKKEIPQPTPVVT